MKNSQRSLLRASMEAAEAEPATSAILAPLQGLDDAKTDEIVEGTFTQVQTEIAELNDLDETIAKNTEVVAGLEAIALELEACGEQPMDSLSNAVLAYSVESALVPVSASTTMEDVIEKIQAENETASDKVSTVREKAKQILARIVEFLKTLWRRLTDLFHKLLGGASVLRHRVKRLNEAMKTHNIRVAPEHNQLDAEHDNIAGSLYASLTIGDTFPSSAVATAKALVAAQAAINSVDNKLADRYEIDLTALVRAIQSRNARDMADSLTTRVAMPSVFHRSANDDGSEITYTAGPLPGNWVFTMQQRYLLKPYPQIQYVASSEQREVKDRVEVAGTMIPVLSSSELTSLGAEVIKLADGMEEGRNLMSRLRKTVEKATPGAESYFMASPEATTVLSHFHHRYRTVGRLTMQVNIAMLKSGIALVRWAEASVAAYPKAA